MTGVGVVLGLVGGFAAVLLFRLIGLITHLTLLHDVGTSLPSLRGYHPGPTLVLVTVGGAVVVSLMAAWSPVIRGHGIPESLEAILTRDSRIRPRAAVAKPLSAAVCIGTGGPFGAEGPIIVTGGSVGSLLGQLLSVSPTERKILLATGAAAGMSATFNAPLAAVVLAVELLLFERSIRTIVPVATAAAVAAAVRVMLMGAEPLFAVHRHLSVGLFHLPLFVVVGALAGLLAVVLDKGLFAVEAGFRALPVKKFWWPVIGAAIYGVIGLFVPRTLSMGYSAISDTLNGHFAIGMLVTLLVAKLISWWFALGSQTSGGTLAPMFLIGATMGASVGTGVSDLLPGLHVIPAAFALVAMGAAFGAAAKAPFTAVIFCAEVTGEYSMVVPLIIGVVAAEIVAGPFFQDRAMTEKLFHRGMRVDFDTWTGVLHQRIVRQVMRPAICLAPGETLAYATRLMSDQCVEAAAVTTASGDYLGLVYAEDLTKDDPGRDFDSIPVSLMVDDGVRPLAPGEFLDGAQLHMIEAGVRVLPVVEGGRVIGRLSRADIDAQQLRRRDLESVQPGLLRQARGRRRAAHTAAVAPARRQTAGHTAFDLRGPAQDPPARGCTSLMPGPGDGERSSQQAPARPGPPRPAPHPPTAQGWRPAARTPADRLNERYAEAIRRLDEDSVPARLTGVHAMAALADDWLDLGDHDEAQTCIDTLCDYLRDARQTSSGTGYARIRETITRLITAHLQPAAQPGWRGMDLDFTGARFTGIHTFAGAVFSGGRVSFEDTQFAGGEVSFLGSIFSGAQVSFAGAEFSGGRVGFNFAEFADGEVSFDAVGFSGSTVTFNFAEFSGGTVSFVGGVRASGSRVSFLSATEFTGGQVSFEDAIFSGGEISFDTARFTGGRVSFTNAKFPDDAQISFDTATLAAPVPGPWPGDTPPRWWPPRSQA